MSYTQRIFAISLFCMAVFVNTAYGSYQDIQMYSEEALKMTTSKECKAWAKDIMSDFEQDQCGSLSGTDYKNCITFSYKPTRKALLYGCRSYDDMWDLYVSRQSPVDILGAFDSDFTNDQFTGRTRLDATGGYIDVNSLGNDQTFQLDDSDSSNYRYTPTGSSPVWSITQNNAKYVISDVRLKNPSENTFDGKPGNMEIQFFFNLDSIVSGPFTTDDTFRGEERIAVSYILSDFAKYNATACSGGGDRPTTFDNFVELQNTVTIGLSDFELSNFYTFAGSDTEAPYSANVFWYVSPYWSNTEKVNTWPLGANYPDRPTPRAIFAEATLYETNGSGEYVVEGCPVA